MRIVLSQFVSLDGVVQAPGGPEEDTDGGFAHGGWSMPYFDPETMGTFIDEASAWPDRDEAIATLKAEGEGDMGVMGSPQLSRMLVTEGLVDEYRLLIEPTVRSARWSWCRLSRPRPMCSSASTGRARPRPCPTGRSERCRRP